MKKNEKKLSIERWSWERVETAVDSVLDKLLDTKHTSFLGVLAVPYGGIIPAVLVSKKIGMKGRIKTLEQDAMKEGHWLIVDEICDSGKTLSLIAKNFPNSVYASLVTTQLGRQVMTGKPFLWGETTTDKWIQFPWELDDEEK